MKHLLPVGFRVGAAAGCVVAFFIAAVLGWHSFWGAWLLMLIAGLASGVAVALFIVRRWPDARYSSENKVDGLGYVWAWGDLIIPYLIFMVLIAVFTGVLQVLRK